MRRRSRAGSVKPRRRKPAAPKRPSGTETARPRLAAASQESEAARLASELSAMSEILRLISNSPSDVGTVLQSVAEQAAHICQARAVDIFLVEDDDLRDVAWFGELKRTTLAFPLDRSTVAGRSVCEMRPVSIDDLQNAGDDFARGREIARRDGHRSILAVPLIRGGRAVGTILIRRTEIRPFEQKHIALLTNFAAQAVIAIENSRLLNELRQRIGDLPAGAADGNVRSSERHQFIAWRLRASVPGHAGECNPHLRGQVWRVVPLRRRYFRLRGRSRYAAGAYRVREARTFSTARTGHPGGRSRYARPSRWSTPPTKPLEAVPRRPVRAATNSAASRSPRRRTDAQGQGASRRYHHLSPGGSPVHGQADRAG